MGMKIAMKKPVNKPAKPVVNECTLNKTQNFPTKSTSVRLRSQSVIPVIIFLTRNL